MGKFEDNIPTFITTLEKQRKDRDLERFNINWGHDCDCEFCDRDGDDADPERYALIIERCRNGEYHDFKSSMATPKMVMVADLRAQGRDADAQSVINGEYDQ